MYFATLVISNEKPTEALLAKLLAPFMPKRLDEFSLGGRFTGWLHPISYLEDTLTGGPWASDGELAVIRQLGSDAETKVMAPSYHSTGVDALRRSNFREAECTPSVILMNGRWHEHVMSEDPEILSTKMAMGLAANYPEFAKNVRIEPEAAAKVKAADAEWQAQFEKLFDQARPDQWLSIVACHT
jgi:hypothetical protein